MPASRGHRMRASLGGDPSIISDLYIDDAGVVTLAAPSVKSPGAQRTQAATSPFVPPASTFTTRRDTTTHSTRKCGVVRSIGTSCGRSASA